jgi:hypothetical protein
LAAAPLDPYCKELPTALAVRDGVNRRDGRHGSSPVLLRACVFSVMYLSLSMTLLSPSLRAQGCPRRAWCDEPTASDAAVQPQGLAAHRQRPAVARSCSEAVAHALDVESAAAAVDVVVVTLRGGARR